MKDLIINLFGTYTPITYNNGTVDVIPNGLSGVDFVWIAGVVLFAITLVCIFKLVGGILSNAFRR